MRLWTLLASRSARRRARRRCRQRRRKKKFPSLPLLPSSVLPAPSHSSLQPSPSLSLPLLSFGAHRKRRRTRLICPNGLCLRQREQDHKTSATAGGGREAGRRPEPQPELLTPLATRESRLEDYMRAFAGGSHFVRRVSLPAIKHVSYGHGRPRRLPFEETIRISNNPKYILEMELWAGERT